MMDNEYIVKDVEGGLIEEETIIRCKDCANRYRYSHCYFFVDGEYCAWAERKGKEE